jgi:hypothetical protein
MMDKPDVVSEVILRETTENWLAAVDAALAGEEGRLAKGLGCSRHFPLSSR